MSDQQTSRGWHVARVTLQAASPLSCGAGVGDSADNAIARDPSGLPYIPGPTLQGLLRAFYRGEDREALFGPETKVGGKHAAARLSFSHALVHDSNDKAVSFPADVAGDALLKKLAHSAPMVRTHVRLDHRHTAEEAGLMERAAVPSGARFSFEVMLFGTADEGTKIDNVLSALAQPHFRIGSSGARGYGKIAYLVAKRGFFPTDKANDLRRLRASCLSDHHGLQQDIAFDPAAACLTISFKLNPINPWRSGQDGAPAFTDAEGRIADQRPLREAYISKENGKLCWQEPAGNDGQAYVLPGSSLRGPLAHRSLYHYNRRNGFLLSDNSQQEALANYLNNKACLEILFGKIEKDGGLASHLLVDDISIELAKAMRGAKDKTPVLAVTHVKIDRFAGGAMASHLFSEERIATEALDCKLYVRRPGEIDEAVRRAFLEAIYDLLDGRLALGAKSYGFCKGQMLAFAGEEDEAWKKSWDEVCKARSTANRAKETATMAEDGVP